MKKLLSLSLIVVITLVGHLFVPLTGAQEQRGLGIPIKTEGGQVIKLYDKSYALVIGVSDYNNGWPKLPGVKKDIEAVSQALERQGFQVTKVENPDSTQLEKSFKDFIDLYGRGVDNRLLFYFAGHGHTSKQSYGDEMGYIVPVEAPLPTRDEAGFMSKAMDMQVMESYARRIQSKHALFLFDSCFSGALFALTRAIPENISYKTSRPVRQFITSGSADERVPDKSIFREQFISALEGEADRDKDGYVTGTELGMFLQDKVINYSRNAQHPQYGTIRNPNLDKGDFVFALKTGNAPSVIASNNNPLPAQPAPAVSPAQQELAFWSSIQNSTDPEDFKDYLAKYPNGQFVTLAKRRMTPKPPDTGTEDTGEAAPLFFPIRLRVRADDASNGWNNIGVTVRAGQRLRVTATGRVSLGSGNISTPAGLPQLADSNKLMRNSPTGGLIAVIGDDNDDFIFIGAHREFVAPRDGRLFLGVNEGNLADNSGTFDVTVEAEVSFERKLQLSDTDPEDKGKAAPLFFPIRLRVRADNTSNGWNDSGLMVRAGQRLRVTATGRVSLGSGEMSTPTGLPRLADSNKLMRNEPTGGLIAVIGADNDDFIFIGAHREFVAQRDGRLFLGVNEGNLGDNSGMFDVTVEAEAVSRPSLH